MIPSREKFAEAQKKIIGEGLCVIVKRITLGSQPLYIRQNINRRIKCVVGPPCATKILGDIQFPRAWYPNALHLPAVSIYALVLPILSTFHTQGLKAQYFRRLKKHKLSVGENGGIVSTMILDLGPLLNGLSTRFAHIMKRSKPTYCIKTRRELSRRESPKAHLRKSGCPVKDSLHNGASRVSSPTTGHPTAYGKFVIDKHTKAENKQKKIYVSVDFLISKSLISRKINP